MLIFSFQLTTNRIGNLTRLILALAICDDYAYIGPRDRKERTGSGAELESGAGT